MRFNELVILQPSVQLLSIPPCTKIFCFGRMRRPLAIQNSIFRGQGNCLSLSSRKGAINAQESQLHSSKFRAHDIKHDPRLAEDQSAVPLAVEFLHQGRHKDGLAGHMNTCRCMAMRHL